MAVPLNPKHKPIHFHRNPKAPQFRQDLLQGPSRNGEQPGDLELSTITPSCLLPNTVISEIVAQYIGDVVCTFGDRDGFHSRSRDSGFVAFEA